MYYAKEHDRGLVYLYNEKKNLETPNFARDALLFILIASVSTQQIILSNICRKYCFLPLSENTEGTKLWL